MYLLAFRSQFTENQRIGNHVVDGMAIGKDKNMNTKV